jgi:hypothetical protein
MLNTDMENTIGKHFAEKANATLRDEFAKIALVHMLQHDGYYKPKDMAVRSYEIADAMLLVRGK